MRYWHVYLEGKVGADDDVSREEVRTALHNLFGGLPGSLLGSVRVLKEDEWTTAFADGLLPDNDILGVEGTVAEHLGLETAPHDAAHLRIVDKEP